MKLVNKLKEKEDKAQDLCSRSLDIITKLTNDIEILDMMTIKQLLEMEQTPARDAALMFYKTELGTYTSINWLPNRAAEKVKELKKKSDMHVNTVKQP